MKKIPVCVSAPVDTYSGYGARSRDFVKALIKSKPEWDIKILSQRWGNTRFGYLADHNEVDLAKRLVPNLTKKPNVWIQITVPNEFQRVGDYNIGVTAGIETTLCDVSWVEGCNRMDLILTSSEHGKLVFNSSKFDKKDQQGNVLETVELTAPVEVLFEGVDVTKYKKVNTSSDVQIVKSLNEIKESFCFLMVGHWLQGDFGQDRKNVGGTIATFLESFKSKLNKPALILKTQQASSSVTDQSHLIGKIDEIKKKVGGANLPNIYLLHGELKDEEVNMVYNHPKVKAMVCLTRGEGFGRPFLEFASIGKPIITSAWSGHTDFLHKDLTLLVGGKLEDVHPSAVIKNMILPESKWFTFDHQTALKAYKIVFKNYKQSLKNAQKQAGIIKRQFTFDKMQEVLADIIQRNVPEFAREEKFKMPGIKKISLPKMQKL